MKIEAMPSSAPRDARLHLRSERVDTPAALGPTRKSRLWLWFVLAFILQLGAWAAWFAIANQHRVETVPLATAGAAR